MSKTIRCKVKVTGITKRVGWDGKESRTVELTPVVSGSKENEEFYKTTPSGNFSFTTFNIQAVDNMDIRKEFYVDITEVE